MQRNRSAVQPRSCGRLNSGMPQPSPHCSTAKRTSPQNPAARDCREITWRTASMRREWKPPIACVPPLPNPEKHTKNNSRSNSRTARSAVCEIPSVDSIERPKPPHKRLPAERNLRQASLGRLRQVRVDAAEAAVVKQAEALRPALRPELRLLPPKRTTIILIS